MMGIKIREFAPLSDLSLEELVPKDNFYRLLQEELDLSFVREIVKGCYAASGRPGVDPEVFFKLQIVLFFEDLRSERQLMEVVADRLSLRWYLGYDLHEPLPDHSSLTRIRERYGVEIFGSFFERVVELSIGAGLVSKTSPSLHTSTRPLPFRPGRAASRAVSSASATSRRREPQARFSPYSMSSA